jgi:hypothetical protein
MHCERSTPAVVTQGKGSLIQDSEQKLPERFRGLLDFIKKQDRIESFSFSVCHSG